MQGIARLISKDALLEVKTRAATLVLFVVSILVIS
jgi:hypothetical protein